MKYIEDMKMLTIKRRAGDTFIIGEDNIVVSVVELSDESVTLGFLTAPDKLVLKEEQIIPHIKIFNCNEIHMEDEGSDS